MARIETPNREAQRSRGATDLGAPWRVIVKNDDHNTFEGVTYALSRTLPGVTPEAGLKLATAIHNHGLAVVWSGHLELAELYHEQLAGFGLTMAPLEQ